MKPVTERIARAMQARQPDSKLFGWYCDIAASILETQGVKYSPDAVESWAKEWAEPGASALLGLFSFFGGDFEAEVRGAEVRTDTLTPEDHAEVINRHVRALVLGKVRS